MNPMVPSEHWVQPSPCANCGKKERFGAFSAPQSTIPTNRAISGC